MSTNTDPILTALQAAQSALNQIPRHKLSGAYPHSYAVASLVDKAVEQRQMEIRSKETPSVFAITVDDADSACAYLCALAFSPYQYHIDDDPAGVLWDVPIAEPQIKTLSVNTDRAFKQLGMQHAWAVYYGASVAAGKMALREPESPTPLPDGPAKASKSSKR